MGIVDNIQKGIYDFMSKNKSELDKKMEEEKLNMNGKQDGRFDSKRVETLEVDGSEFPYNEDNCGSRSVFTDELLLDEELDGGQDDEEINVVNTDSPIVVDESIRRELELLKRNICGMSEKLDAVIMTLENKPNPNSNGDRMSEIIINRLTTLTDQQKTLDNQQEIIKRQHDALLKFNDDVIRKTQNGLILEMISIADQVRMIMENKREDESYDLMQGLMELEESIEASLSNNSVKRYSEANNDATILNRRRQTVLGNELTTDPNKDGHFKSVAPGYEWTMPYLVVNSEVRLKKILEENQRPQTFSFVIRPEEVMKLRYKEPLERKTQDSSEDNISDSKIGCESDDTNIIF